MFRYFSLAFRNTLRNKRRSILTIASMAVSLCLLGVLMAMYHALFLKDQTPGQAMRLITRNKVSLAQPIPISDENKIRSVPGVKEVSVWNWFGGTYKDARNSKNFFGRFGVEPKPFLTIRTQLEMPEDARKAFVSDKTACILSEDTATNLNLHVGDRITLIGDIYPITLELKLVGIYKDPDAQASMFFNWAYLSDALPVGRRSYISTVAILADNASVVPAVARSVDALFENTATPTKTESEAQFALSFVSLLGNIKLFLVAICAAVTFTILLVSGNTMAMSVRERIKEVGVLKTLGFNNDAILGMIIGEALSISLIGGIIGLAMAGILSIFVGHAAGDTLPQLHDMNVTPLTALVGLGVAAFIGIISSFVPALNAARTNILDSLRFSG